MNDIDHQSYFVLFIRDTGMASSQPSGNLSNSFPDGIPVGNLIPLMRREFPMGSHKLLFGYRFLSCSDPKLSLGRHSMKSIRRSLLVDGAERYAPALTSQPRTNAHLFNVTLRVPRDAPARIANSPSKARRA
jgi:hypothetical protein